jgi:predicted DNA-binding transcriptional regulator AlpA
MPTQTAPIALATAPALGGDADTDQTASPPLPPQSTEIPLNIVTPAQSAGLPGRPGTGHPIAARAPPAADDLLTGTAVKAALGGISEMTLWRWTKALGFPPPDYVLSRRKFWRRRTIEAWLAEREMSGRAA